MERAVTKQMENLICGVTAPVATCQGYIVFWNYSRSYSVHETPYETGGHNDRRQKTYIFPKLFMMTSAESDFPMCQKLILNKIFLGSVDFCTDILAYKVKISFCAKVFCPLFH